MNSAKVSAIDRLIGIIWKLNHRCRHIPKNTILKYYKALDMIHRGFNRDKGPTNSRNIRSNRVSSETLLSSRESKLRESKAICSGKKIVDSCGSGWY